MMPDKRPQQCLYSYDWPCMHSIQGKAERESTRPLALNPSPSPLTLTLT